MERLSTEKKHAFELFLKELRNELTPYFKEKGLSFSNRQLFSFVLNMPFIFGINADGRSNIKNNIKTILKESGYWLLPQDLPLIFDDLKEVETYIPEKDFEEIYYKEENFLVANFSKYEEILNKTLKLYCEKTGYIDKYEMINKIYRMTKSSFKNEELLENPKYSFIKEFGIKISSFDKNNYELDEEQWQKIYSIPYLIFYIVAASDQKISKKEIKEFDKFITEDSHSNNPLIEHIFLHAKEICDSQSSDLKVSKQKELITELTESIKVLDAEFKFYEAGEIKRLALKLAYDVAASAGFFGISFVAYQESKQINKLAQILSLSKIDGETVKFGKQVKIGKKEISYKSFYRKLYANHITKSIVEKLGV